MQGSIRDSPIANSKMSKMSNSYATAEGPCCLGIEPHITPLVNPRCGGGGGLKAVIWPIISQARVQFSLPTRTPTSHINAAMALSA